jgi:hypothetical protein
MRSSIERVSRFVATELADEAAAKSGYRSPIASRILCLTNRPRSATVLVQHPVVIEHVALSIAAERQILRAQEFRSRMKPKVRARLISFRNEVVEKSMGALRALKIVIELDLEIHRNRCTDRSAPTCRRPAPDRLEHAHETLRRRLLWMRPTAIERRTDQLPSMIGTSSADRST